MLLVTGLALFIPALGFLAQDSWTRVIHRLAAVVFVAAPVLYVLVNPKAAMEGLKSAFEWGKADVGWAMAAPRYYFLCDEECMPPQGHMNTGQKMWWLMVIVFGVIFLATGVVMWAFKTVAPAPLLQAAVLIHDIALVAVAPMFFVHVYLSAFHPLMVPQRTGALSSMVRGKVSVDYAQAHHAKWYAEVANGERVIAQ